MNFSHLCIEGLHLYNTKSVCKGCGEVNMDAEENKMPVTEIGMVCVYCGAETEVGCCAELHHEIGYETKDGELVLESELTEAHVIVEEL